MFKFLPTAFLVHYSPFLIAVWKWNASIKSYDKEKLTSNFDHFVNLFTFTNSLENGRKIKTRWESWLFTNFPPRTHHSNYAMSSEDVQRSHLASFFKATRRTEENINQRPKRMKKKTILHQQSLLIFHLQQW